MNPTQFYISTAVMPVTTIIIVLIGVLPNNKRMDDLSANINRRFDDLRSHVDQRFTALDKRIDDSTAALNQRIETVDRRIDELRAEFRAPRR